jgi:hypothetical protein
LCGSLEQAVIVSTAFAARGFGAEPSREPRPLRDERGGSTAGTFYAGPRGVDSPERALIVAGCEAPGCRPTSNVAVRG